MQQVIDDSTEAIMVLLRREISTSKKGRHIVHESETCYQRAPRSPYRHSDVLYVFLDVPLWLRDKHVHYRAHTRRNRLCSHLVYRFTGCPVKTKSRLSRQTFHVNPRRMTGELAALLWHGQPA